MFKNFAKAVRNQFDAMAKGELYVVAVGKDQMWDAYMNAFPEGTNKIYRERREYECNYCSQFIKRVGNVVSIVDGKLVSVWDVVAEGYYQEVADKLSELVKSAPIRTKFLYNEKNISVESNHELDTNGTTVNTWNHFSCVLPDRFVKQDYGSILSDINATHQVFSRGLDELTEDAIEITLDLIYQDSIYRGAEFKGVVEGFAKLKKGYSKIPTEVEKSIYIWDNINNPSARIRNTAIGTLLQDISEGVDLTKAVKAFESKVAPSNYKRTSAPITKGMVKQAMQTINDLGIEPALHRRYAVIGDVSVNDVLFADRSVTPLMKDSLEDMLLGEVSTPQVNFDNIEEIGIDEFLANVLPKSTALEVYVGNEHKPNLMSLVAPVDPDAKNILKWDNNFTWSYNGGVADSMRDAVVEAGGRVDGDFRFTHSWNHNGENQSLMDLHVFFPTSNRKHQDTREVNDNYGNGERVGWNNRKHHKTGGVQDVDFVNQPVNEIPLENITFPNKSRMPEGTYTLKIHNWNRRCNKGKGFKAEIEFDGKVYQYNYDKEIANKEWITVARVTLKNGKFSIEHVLESSADSQDVWGIKTEKFVKVSSVMLSPNHWDGQEAGNKHFFFILDDCKNPESCRGLYNEYLNNDLMKHRKVFEVLASKMQCPYSDEQLSGLGFSSTARNELIVKVEGSFTRTLKIKF